MTHCVLLLLQTNTFQAVLVTDGANSFALFIYRCGDLQWSGGGGFEPGSVGATIGFGASSELFSNHRLSGTPSVTSIACLNTPDNQFFTVLYEITNSTEGKEYTLLEKHTRCFVGTETFYFASALASI